MTPLTSFTHHLLAPLHRILGWVPFAWLLTFGLIVGRGVFQLGHLPHYRSDPDASTGLLFWAEFSLFLLGMLVVPVWGLLTVYLLAAAPGMLRRNALSVCLCLLGIGGFVGVRLWQPDLLAWVAD